MYVYARVFVFQMDVDEALRRASAAVGKAPNASRFNVYLYDGYHDVESQYNAFIHFDSVLDDVFIAIVDDWNWAAVRAGTSQAFDKLGYHVIHSMELSSDGNADWQGWWNGLYVAVVAKTKTKTSPTS